VNRISLREYGYVKEVLDSEFRGKKGPSMCKRLEDSFCKVLNIEHAVSTSSGTAALHCALAACGIRPGDEVIVPPLTMASTSLAVLYQGATPVYADVDPDTFTLDPISVVKAITKRTRAIIPVHLYGLPVDMDAIMNIARVHDLLIIEDCAQSMLSKYKDKLTGTMGHVGIFSLQASKHLTCGEGGILVTSDSELAARARAFSSVGYGDISKEDLQDPKCDRHVSFGFKYKMSELCAAVAMGQLENVENLVEARKVCTGHFLQAVFKCDWITTQRVPQNMDNSRYTFAVKLEGIDWYLFRDLFLKWGGDGLYAAWKLTYNEPFWWTSFDHRVQGIVKSERYQGDYRAYWADKCPVAEDLQPRIVQFKTNYLDEEDMEREAVLIGKTIQSVERKCAKTT